MNPKDSNIYRKRMSTPHTTPNGVEQWGYLYFYQHTIPNGIFCHLL
jgi:hypothetical protein